MASGRRAIAPGKLTRGQSEGSIRADSLAVSSRGGLTYVSSWVGRTMERCYQLMETNDRAILDQWIANWSDLADFEVHPVISSNEAAEQIALRL